MAIRSREEIITQLKTQLGDNTDDGTISFLEDVSDTLDDLESKASDTTNWEQKYKDNDAEWRKKYTERFYSPKPKDEPDEPDEPDEANTPKTFAELFKTV